MSASKKVWQIQEELRIQFGAEENQDKWLNTKMDCFEGMTPREMIKDSLFDAVLDVLDRLASSKK